MKLGLKFNKNTLLSVVFAIVLIVFALYLIKALDKNREGNKPAFGGPTAKQTIGTTKSATVKR
jgi:hypothetical protein